MSLRWTQSRVTLTNASNKRMRVTGEAEVYCAAENGKVKKIRVIISLDLADQMLLGWQAQIKLGLLDPSWPQVWDYGQCNQVNHEEQKKQDSPVAQEETQRQQQEFPLDKQECPAVSQLLMEFEDIFYDKLNTSDHLATGNFPQDAWVLGSSQGPS